MKKRVTFDVDLSRARAFVSRNCDEKYARKLLQDWLKSHTMMQGGWQVVKDFDRWDDTEYYFFTVENIFLPLEDNYMFALKTV